MRAAFVITVCAVAACGRSGFDSYAPMLAWYPLDDDPSSGMIQDASGNGHGASCTPGSTCPARTQGRNGGVALAFDGQIQALTTDPTGLELPPPYSIAVWARPDGLTADFGCLVCRPLGTGSDDTYAVYLTKTGDSDFATTGAYELFGPTLVEGTWTHLAATHDGTTKLLDANGAAVAMQPAPPEAADAHSVYLGADIDNGAEVGHFYGAMSDVRIYARVLDVDEVAALAR